MKRKYKRIVGGYGWVSDYDMEHRQIRYWNPDSGHGKKKWEKFVGFFTGEEVITYLKTSYPEFVGLPLFENILERFGEGADKEPLLKDDIDLSLLKYMPKLRLESENRDYPSLLERIVALENKVFGEKNQYESTTSTVTNKTER